MLGRLMDVLSGLLGQRAPKFMSAAGFSDSPHFMYSGKFFLIKGVPGNMLTVLKDKGILVNGFNSIG